MISISAIIIAKNEASTIARCINSLNFATEVIVVSDPSSTDDTSEIANKFGARVIEQPWLGFGRQKQFATDQAKSDWIFSIDADEWVSVELLNYLKKINNLNPRSVLFFSRRSYFLGAPVRFSGWSPDYVGRLFNRKYSHFSDDIVHEKLENFTNSIKVPANLKILHTPYPNRNTVNEKTFAYARLSASKLVQAKHPPKLLPIICLKTAFSGFKTMFLGLGILDGLTGLRIARMNMKYTFLKYSLHARLMKRKRRLV